MAEVNPDAELFHSMINSSDPGAGAEVLPLGDPEGEHTVEFKVRIKGFGHRDQLTRELSSYLGRALWRAFGADATYYRSGRRVSFDPSSHPGEEGS
jgi:hypothetical protein